MSAIGAKKRFAKRIGNIDFQVWEDEHGKVCRNEIVKYEPNWYYYHKDEFIEDEARPGMFVKKDEKTPYYAHVHESCFKNEENQYTLADFREDWDGDYLEGYDLIYCGARPVEYLDRTEEKDFMELVRYGYNYLKIKMDEQKEKDW